MTRSSMHQFWPSAFKTVNLTCMTAHVEGEAPGTSSLAIWKAWPHGTSWGPQTVVWTPWTVTLSRCTMHLVAGSPHICAETVTGPALLYLWNDGDAVRLHAGGCGVGAGAAG